MSDNLFLNAWFKYEETKPVKCKIIRKVTEKGDRFFEENNLDDEAPCYIIELNGQTTWAMINEIEEISDDIKSANDNPDLLA